MQGHGRTADVPRDITYENLADDVAALLTYLKIPRADLIGYSMDGGAAMQCAIRHPDKVRRAVIISSTFRRDGIIAEAQEAIPKLTADAFKGSPIEAEYKKLSPTPDDFPNFVQRIVATFSKRYDFGADKLNATTTPMFFIHGDADGVRLAHIAEMFLLKGGEIHGDMSALATKRAIVHFRPRWCARFVSRGRRRYELGPCPLRAVETVLPNRVKRENCPGRAIILFDRLRSGLL